MGRTVVWSVKDTTYGLAVDTGKVVWENKTERFANHSLGEGKRDLVLVVGHHYKPSSSCDRSAVGQDTLVTRSRHGWNTGGQAANLLAIAGDKLVAFRYKLPPIDPKTNKYVKKVATYVTAWPCRTQGWNGCGKMLTS